MIESEPIQYPETEPEGYRNGTWSCNVEGRWTSFPPGVTSQSQMFLNKAALEGAFERIKENHRDLILSYFSTDRSVGQLAEDLGKHRNTVYNTLLRGLGNLWWASSSEVMRNLPQVEVVKLKDQHEAKIGKPRSEGYKQAMRKKMTPQRRAEMAKKVSEYRQNQKLNSDLGEDA
jgi:hypothetical protein